MTIMIQRNRNKGIRIFDSQGKIIVEVFLVKKKKPKGTTTYLMIDAPRDCLVKRSEKCEGVTPLQKKVQENCMIEEREQDRG